MANTEIKLYAKNRKVNLWQVAEKAGYAHDSSFSKALRHELPDERKKEIMAIIDELAAE